MTKLLTALVVAAFASTTFAADAPKADTKAAPAAEKKADAKAAQSAPAAEKKADAKK